jgi:hypothetical protein
MSSILNNPQTGKKRFHKPHKSQITQNFQTIPENNKKILNSIQAKKDLVIQKGIINSPTNQNGALASPMYPAGEVWSNLQFSNYLSLFNSSDLGTNAVLFTRILYTDRLDLREYYIACPTEI